MPKEKGQSDKQRSTKHTYILKTKDRATLTSQNPGVNSGSFCSTCGTRRVTLVTHTVISHE